LDIYLQLQRKYRLTLSQLFALWKCMAAVINVVNSYIWHLIPYGRPPTQPASSVTKQSSPTSIGRQNHKRKKEKREKTDEDRITCWPKKKQIMHLSLERN